MPEPLGNFKDFKEGFELDMKLLDGYVNYSAELLRLSLLAITGIATLCVTLHTQDKTSFHTLIRHFALSLVALLLSSLSALAHRFIATDSMSCQLRSLRLHARASSAAPKTGDREEAKKEEKGRTWRFSASEKLLWSSATALLIGILIAGCELASWSA